MMDQVAPGVLKDNEYWMRCPFCGDSQKSHDKVHFSFSVITGLFHCYRCQVSGKFSRKQRETLLSGDIAHVFESSDTAELDQRDPANDLSILLSFLLPGPGSSRFSALRRYHVATDQGPVDAFEVRDQMGNLLGIHLRPSWIKSFRTIGHRGLGYPGTRNLLPEPFVRLVEGPYDVVTPNDVCTFGFPNVRQLKLIKSYPVILCPDGDVWTLRERFNTYFKGFDYRIPICTTLAIEVLSGDKDPDEVAVVDRRLVPVYPLHLVDVAESIWSELNPQENQYASRYPRRPRRSREDLPG